MTTHLASWSKMSFHKKSKPSASAGGHPSPKASRKTGHAVSQSDIKETDNNNDREIEEAEFRNKIDLESKSRQLGVVQ